MENHLKKMPSPLLSLVPILVLVALLFVTIRTFGSDALSGGSQVVLLTTTAVASLSAETGDGLTLESVLGDQGMEEELVEHLDLKAAIARLSQREQLVIQLRYFRAFTQEQTARVIGVRQVQVSRIERRAVDHLRGLLES